MVLVRHTRYHDSVCVHPSFLTTQRRRYFIDGSVYGCVRGCVSTVAQDTTVRNNTLAKNHAAEFEKLLLCSLNSIGFLEKLGRKKIMDMILDRRKADSVRGDRQGERARFVLFPLGQGRQFCHV